MWSSSWNWVSNEVFFCFPSRWLQFICMKFDLIWSSKGSSWSKWNVLSPGITRGDFPEVKCFCDGLPLYPSMSIFVAVLEYICLSFLCLSRPMGFCQEIKGPCYTYDLILALSSHSQQFQTMRCSKDKIPQPTQSILLPFLTLSRWAQSWLQTPSWLSAEISQQLLQGIPHIKILLLLFWLIFWLDIQNWFNQISAQNPFSSSLITCLFLTSLLRRGSGIVSSWRWSYAISLCLSSYWVGIKEITTFCCQPGTQLSLCCLPSTRLKIEPPGRSWEAGKLQRGIDWYPNIWILFILSSSFTVLRTDSPSGHSSLLLLWVWALVNDVQIKVIVPVTCLPWN